MSIVNNVCTNCGSDRAGYVCGCGVMRCSCSSECPTCDQQQEQEMQEQQYQAEQDERARFEDEMDEKYGRR